MRKKNSIIISLISISLLFLPLLIQAQDEKELKNIHLNKSSGEIEIHLAINMPVNYESFTLFNPDRLVIDLLEVQAFSCEPLINVNDFGVMLIRTAKNQPQVTRVVFELEEKVPSYAIAEKEDGIYITFRPAAVEEEVIKEESVQVKEEKPAIKEVKKEEPKPKKEEKPKITPRVPPPRFIKTEETPRTGTGIASNT